MKSNAIGLAIGLSLAALVGALIAPVNLTGPAIILAILVWTVVNDFIDVIQFQSHGDFTRQAGADWTIEL